MGREVAMGTKIDRSIANEHEDFGKNLRREDGDGGKLVPCFFQGPNFAFDVTDILVDCSTRKARRFISLVGDFKRISWGDCISVAVSGGSFG